MKITDEQVAKAVRAAYEDAGQRLEGSWMPPARAKVADHQGDRDALRAADEDAERINNEAMRRILEAAFE